MSQAQAHQPDGERLINVGIGAGLHRRAKAAAALRGMTLQDFVRRSLEGAISLEQGMRGSSASQQNGISCTNVVVDPAA